MNLRRIILTGVAMAVCLPSTALAAKAEVVVTRHPCPHLACGDYYETRALYFRAAPGEANAVTVTGNGQATTFADSGAPVEAGPGCERVDDHTARCAGTSPIVEAGDGADSITRGPGSSPGLLQLRGGPGDDVIIGGAEQDILDGGGGRDRLDGGAGEDTIADRDGGTPDSDVLIGGDGRDRLDYADHVANMTADLRAPRAGIDEISGFEDVSGGAGDDTLTAGASDAVLAGGAGDDRLTGGPGNDELYGDAGSDLLRGNGGNDLFDTRDAAPDRILCGTGRDRVTGDEEVDDGYGGSTSMTTGPDARDLLGLDCEYVDADEPEHPVHVRPLSTGAGQVRFRKPCRSCIGRVTVSVGGRTLGTARLRNGALTVTVRLARPLPRGRVFVSWRYGIISVDTVAAFSVVLRPPA